MIYPTRNSHRHPPKPTADLAKKIGVRAMGCGLRRRNGSRRQPTSPMPTARAGRTTISEPATAERIGYYGQKVSNRVYDLLPEGRRHEACAIVRLLFKSLTAHIRETGKATWGPWVINASDQNLIDYLIEETRNLRVTSEN